MSTTCSHLDFAGETCPECSEEVDAYGNTESVFKYCCFPDCGCDGARLCMAGDANGGAVALNIEKGSKPIAPIESPEQKRENAAWMLATQLIAKIKRLKP